MKKNDMVSWLESNSNYESLRVAVCDLNGIWRGKRILSNTINKVLTDGVRMPLSSSCIDIWGSDLIDSPFLFNSGDGDGIALSTGNQILPVTWLDRPTAILPCWLYDDKGLASLIDPRHILKAVCDQYLALGLTAVAAFELEFYLLDSESNKPIRPINPISKKRLLNTSVLSVDDLDAFESFFSDVYSACKAHNIPADTAISENAAGQFEINLKHTNDILASADHAVFFKRLLKGVAQKHSFKASFMAKPFPDSAGNGMHLHLSILDTKGINVFDDNTAYGSKILKNAIAGLLGSMIDSTLIFAPHLNSYRRLQLGSHAPTSVCWGYENRTASIRVPGGDTKNRRIEHRVPGADANPYLVAAVILSAALDGIKRKLEPPDPVEGDSYSKNFLQIPSNWLSSMNEFKNSSLNKKVHSKTFLDVFANCKLQEYTTFAERMEDFEISTYLDAV